MFSLVSRKFLAMRNIVLYSVVVYQSTADQALDRQSSEWLSELRRLVERYMKAFHSSSPALKYPNTYLYCCFPKCWFFVQWRTSRRIETCADQTRRDVRIIMRTFHSVHGISTYLAQRVTMDEISWRHPAYFPLILPCLLSSFISIAQPNYLCGWPRAAIDGSTK